MGDGCIARSGKRENSHAHELTSDAEDTSRSPYATGTSQGEQVAARLRPPSKSKASCRNGCQAHRNSTRREEPHSGHDRHNLLVSHISLHILCLAMKAWNMSSVFWIVATRSGPVVFHKQTYASTARPTLPQNVSRAVVIEAGGADLRINHHTSSWPDDWHDSRRDAPSHAFRFLKEIGRRLTSDAYRYNLIASAYEAVRWQANRIRHDSKRSLPLARNTMRASVQSTCCSIGPAAEDVSLSAPPTVRSPSRLCGRVFHAPCQIPPRGCARLACM